jgi:hypothetical protein
VVGGTCPPHARGFSLQRKENVTAILGLRTKTVEDAASHPSEAWIKQGILDESKTDWQRNGGNGMIWIRLSQDFFIPLPPFPCQQAFSTGFD